MDLLLLVVLKAFFANGQDVVLLGCLLRCMTEKNPVCRCLSYFENHERKSRYCAHLTGVLVVPSPPLRLITCSEDVWMRCAVGGVSVAQDRTLATPSGTLSVTDV